MGIRSTLEYIGDNFPNATSENYKNHPVANFIRNDAKAAVSLPLKQFGSIKVDSSAGAGVWADVPWIAALDQRVTNFTTRGYYVVYLFSTDGSEVYLTLAQGVTLIYEEFGRYTNEELRRRAAIIEERVSGKFSQFDTGVIDLGARTPLAKRYEQSVAIWKRYEIANLPDEKILEADLITIVEAYGFLFAEGGTESVAAVLSEPESDEDMMYGEAKRYSLHYAIERNKTLARQVKKKQGFVCVACEFDFQEVYGNLGAGYIEAHHLTPLASLEDGKTVQLDPVKDFAVLCANCHRMVHRDRKVLLSVDELKVILAANAKGK